VDDEIRETLSRYLASRRTDPEFEARLQRLVEEARPVLDALAPYDGIEETQRQDHNARVRFEAMQHAAVDRAVDRGNLLIADAALADLSWWSWRKRRWWRETIRLIRADRPVVCPVCGCEHRPSAGCPEDFIPATPLGIMTTEGIEEYDGG
jgi:hypothetical protein